VDVGRIVPQSRRAVIELINFEFRRGAGADDPFGYQGDHVGSPLRGRLAVLIIPWI